MLIDGGIPLFPMETPYTTMETREDFDVAAICDPCLGAIGESSECNSSVNADLAFLFKLFLFHTFS